MHQDYGTKDDGQQRLRGYDDCTFNKSTIRDPSGSWIQHPRVATPLISAAVLCMHIPGRVYVRERNYVPFLALFSCEKDQEELRGIRTRD